MNLANKLFSLLGFSEPVELLRFQNLKHKTPLLPPSVLVLSIDENDEKNLQQPLCKLLKNLVIQPVLAKDFDLDEKVSAMIIDARHYCLAQSYQRLYQLVHDNLKYLSLNARIVVLASTGSAGNNHEKQAFSRALLGFTKSLAKEVGRKGTTANILYSDDSFYEGSSESNSEGNKNNEEGLKAPLTFCLSSKSSFISGQALSLNNNGLIVDSREDINEGSRADTNKVALVTGAAQGIGLSIAQTLARDGFTVIGLDIEQAKNKLNEEMQAIKGLALTLDISTDDAGEQIILFLKGQQLSGLDVIVHNAGITRDKTLAKMPEHWWQSTLNINLLSVMRINQTLLEKNAIKTNGRIVCMSSMNGIAGQAGQTNYATSKAGLIGYVESFSQAVKIKGITINAVAPGFIETQMTEQIPFITREIGRRMNALAQGGKPIDVAEAVAFFAQEETSAITGQTLRVCGLNFIGA